MSSALDELAPRRERVVSFSKSSPWYTTELRAMKMKSRQLERQYKKSGLTVHKLMYDGHLSQYAEALKAARTKYYSSIISDGAANPNKIFKTINSLLAPIKSPVCSSVQECNKFLSFFMEKIENIYKSISLVPCSAVPVIFPPSFPESAFSSFNIVTNDCILKLVMAMNTTTCTLDPVPTSVLKECLSSISPLILNIVNTSLTTGTVPKALKVAAITPVLKKPGCDKSDLSNYRPISNLPFLAKVLERVVVAQLHSHLSSNKLFEPFQSGFRKGHSTETALVRVMNDLLVSADSGASTILVLLDLSAAFDTVCHSILINRLERWLGITGTVLNWFKSYLTDRTQFVALGNNKSELGQVCHGVPQGSVIGPILFSVYMLPLGQIIRKYGLGYHFYADDTQIYISSKSDPTLTSTILSECVLEIKTWMHHNFLKLNCSKTEVLLIGTPAAIHKGSNLNLIMDDSVVLPSAQARNLGVIFDTHLTLDSHIKNITKSAFHHLRNIARIRPFLTPPDAERLIHAFVTSRIDYCNALFIGLPAKSIKRLQYIQNSAARILTYTPSGQHITGVLYSLHWLPVQSRIVFKTLTLTYKAIHGTAPSYICDLVTRYTPSRSLRSADSLTLQQPPYRLKSMGERAFSVAAPRLWNALPVAVRDAHTLASFKKLLKTHLFKIAFMDCQ